MSVIVEFRVASSDFELGRILSVQGSSYVELERLVPIGDAAVLLIWIHNSTRDSILGAIEDHQAVNKITEMDVFEDRTLIRLDWDLAQDRLLEGIKDREAQILGAVGQPDTWRFELRFPDHNSLNGFSTFCDDSNIHLEVDRIYNPTSPDAGPWYGLTEAQHEAITLAVEMGYYNIPRGCTTKELADEFGISDQAVTERLRRAIVALVTNTLNRDWKD